MNALLDTVHDTEYTFTGTYVLAYYKRQLLNSQYVIHLVKPLSVCQV